MLPPLIKIAGGRCAHEDTPPPGDFEEDGPCRVRLSKSISEGHDVAGKQRRDV